MSHLLNHQVSKCSSCSSTMWLHSKLLLSHSPSRISTRRISLQKKDGGQTLVRKRCWKRKPKGRRGKNNRKRTIFEETLRCVCVQISATFCQSHAWCSFQILISRGTKQTPLCGRLTRSLDWTGQARSPCLILGQFPLLPGCVASTKVLLYCPVKALKTQNQSQTCTERQRKH